MSAKTRIVDLLGERALVVPALIATALTANEQAKYLLSLLQMAAAQAESPQIPAPTLKDDREACGIDEPSLDRTIALTENDGDGHYHIPGSGRILARLQEALRAMIAPLDKAGQPAAVEYAHRLDRLTATWAGTGGDMLEGAAITAMTSGRPAAGDGLHVLIMDLHRDLNHLQATIACEEVAGAKAYGLEDADRATVAAFMAGLNRTAPLKFDHPGLDTVAVRSGDTLLIQNDIGTTEAHVLVVKVVGRSVTVIYTDVHLSRLRFLQTLSEDSGLAWQEVRAREATVLEKEDLFYTTHGTATLESDEDLHFALNRLASHIVFLIDWNKARKRLGLLVPNEVAVEILAWAASHDFGHRAFLSLGGERLIYDALEQAVKTPLRYGEPLHEMMGVDVARGYLCFVLQTTAIGLLQGRSDALIRDQVRAELFTHFRTADQRLLTICADHAAAVSRLAEGLRSMLQESLSDKPLTPGQNATRAKLWESQADESVKALRVMARRLPGTEVFCRVIEEADDAADHLEEAAFQARLLFEAVPPEALPKPLLDLADLIVACAQAYRRAVDLAQHVQRGAAQDTVQHFLEASDGIVTLEHQADERHRAVVALLMAVPDDPRRLQLLSGLSQGMEQATDALQRAALILRDHMLAHVTFA
ncbi:hypothetical protein AZA_57138 [Nitrospirillum viridazoti Y2]|uniref:Uncharacterized protein Yka (UPF0111/DUF47 family) n=1 Tax=Nitrospirillum amazonense TaxID=28077 RepID=A0A560I004_9PROT|nr:DUF47 family protein [Nitrospirillum amazonense]EGY01353.1 hypothetical protein AZA_57138 [Nitrospirillum amazonense Y2]TWB52238.1 uncharacterized protein Yka (UPF0111/DUF47 family) [Nitrospirillum amazonense]